MGYIVRMPKLGLEMERGELLEWHVDEGDAVSEGETVVEVESEKSVADIDARENGILHRRYLEAGGTVPPGTPIGIIAPADEDISDLEGEATADLEEQEAEPEAKPQKSAAEPAQASSSTAETAGSTGSSQTDDGGEISASPRARKRADELDVDLTTVEGTGYRGAISEDDVEAAAGSAGSEETSADDVRASPRAIQRADELGVDLAAVEGTGYQGSISAADVEAAAERSDAAGPGGDARTLREERPFDGMRRTIASRLGESYREAVHVTVSREGDAEELLAAAEAADEALETDVSIQDVLLLAVSAALTEHPEFNATFEDGVHRLWEDHNVGVAVDIEQGLIAPVLEDVGGSSLTEIAKNRRELVERATSGEYTMGDLSGGTFTVTNLGVFGVESFDPVINPPQVAILGVNAIAERPVRGENDAPTWQRHLPFDLSFDHRVVDGADAARFLESLVSHVEDPWSLLPGEVPRSASDAGDATATETEMPGRRVTAHNPDGMGGRVEAGSFEWRYDEPEEAGGAETGPTPVDVFLGSLASCLSLSIRYQAEKRDVAVGAIDVTAEGAPDRGSVERIEPRIRLETDADDETIDRIVTIGERGCHVSQLLREDLELDLSWERV